MNDYQIDLKRRQAEHLEMVRNRATQNTPFIACLHDSCPSCKGTGVKLDGSPCAHYLSCRCPKCSPYHTF